MNKLNPVHDLVICLSGAGKYRIGDTDEWVSLNPGQAMLIPAYTRFHGKHGGGSDTFIGVAQHFSLELFERGDAIRQLRLKRAVDLPDWGVLESVVKQYRLTNEYGSTTLVQQHRFMILLLAYFEAAFQGWKTTHTEPAHQDRLSLEIMFVVSRLSADPLGATVSDVLADVPFNEDYFRRAFQDRIGMTPKKFGENKRMEYAADRLGMGLTVKAVAAELGYSDPYFFSRQFKRYIGASPSHYRVRYNHSSNN
ncbi:MAG: helix-turn-helix domain-containing protein [Granulosicoccus sp.]